jgi:two-component system, cell cycle response regulator CpdR
MTVRANTVLVVDDERDLVSLLATTLRKHGFIVREAVGSDEAIAVCEDRRLTLDLVLSDFQMPGILNGLELADHIVSGRPNIAVILMSANFSRLDTISARGFEFIEKPFSLDDIVSRIAQRLSKRPMLR